MALQRQRGPFAYAHEPPCKALGSLSLCQIDQGASLALTHALTVREESPSCLGTRRTIEP